MNQVPFKWTWKNYAAAKFTQLSRKQLESRELRSLRKNDDLDPEFLLQNFDRKFISKPHVSKLNDISIFQHLSVWPK